MKTFEVKVTFFVNVPEDTDVTKVEFHADSVSLVKTGETRAIYPTEFYNMIVHDIEEL